MKATLVVVWLTACSGTTTASGGGSGGQTGSAPGVSLQKYEDANCMWSQGCGHGGSCSPARPPGDQPLFRGEIVDEMTACQAKLACTENDDVCGDDILAREFQNATGTRRTALDACPTSYGRCSYDQLECLSLAIMVDGALPRYDACFASTDCVAMALCLRPLGFQAQPVSN